MIFVNIFSYPPQNRDALQARFKATGGKPPEGIKMIGRWHGIGGGKGVVVCEADDPVALGKWAQEWSDLMSMEIYPAVDDQGALKRIG
jgi:hypothetical protein